MPSKYKPIAINKRKIGTSNVCVGSEYTADELEFMMAMDRYKSEYHKPFPTWCEVYRVVQSLGYRKIAPKCSIESILKKRGKESIT